MVTCHIAWPQLNPSSQWMVQTCPVQHMWMVEILVAVLSEVLPWSILRPSIWEIYINTFWKLQISQICWLTESKILNFWLHSKFDLFHYAQHWHDTTRQLSLWFCFREEEWWDALTLSGRFDAVRQPPTLITFFSSRNGFKASNFSLIWSLLFNWWRSVCQYFCWTSL